jgi:hypothetical protein
MQNNPLVPASMTIDRRLPAELLARILYELSPLTAIKLSRVNRTFRRIVCQEQVYWRQHYCAQYGGEVCRQGKTWCDDEEIAECMDSEATLRAFLLGGIGNPTPSASLHNNWYAAYTARANLALRWQRSSTSAASPNTTVTPRLHLLGELTPVPDNGLDVEYATTNPWRRSMINVHVAYTVVANEQGVWITPHPRHDTDLPPSLMICRPAYQADMQSSILPSPPKSPAITSAKSYLLSGSQTQVESGLIEPTLIYGYNPKRCWSNDRWVVVAGICPHSTPQRVVYYVWKGDTGRKVLDGEDIPQDLFHTEFDYVANALQREGSSSSSSDIATPSSVPICRHTSVLLAGSQLLECTVLLQNESISDTIITAQRWSLSRNLEANETLPCRDYVFQPPQHLWSSAVADTSEQGKEMSSLSELRASKLRPHLVAGIRLIVSHPGTQAGNNLEIIRQLRILFWDLHQFNASHTTSMSKLSYTDTGHSAVTLSGIYPFDPPTICQDFTNEALIVHGNAFRALPAQEDHVEEPFHDRRIYHWIACCSFPKAQSPSEMHSSGNAKQTGRELWRRTYRAWQGIWSAQPLHAVGLLAVAFGEGVGSYQDPWLIMADKDPMIRDFPLGNDPSQDGLHILSLADGSLLRTFSMRPTRLIDAVGPIVIVTWDNVRHGVAAVDAVAGCVRWRQRFPEDEPDHANDDTSLTQPHPHTLHESITHGWLDVRVSPTRLLMMERGRRIRRRDKNNSNIVRCEERMLIVDFA